MLIIGSDYIGITQCTVSKTLPGQCPAQCTVIFARRPTAMSSSAAVKLQFSRHTLTHLKVNIPSSLTRYYSSRTPHNYRRFREDYFLRHNGSLFWPAVLDYTEYWHWKPLRNAGNCIPIYTASYCRRFVSSSLLLVRPTYLTQAQKYWRLC